MKQASRLPRLLPLAAAFLVLTGSACQKKTPERVWERGAFKPLPENTESYTLPDGVTIVTSIGYDDVIPASELPLLTTFRNNKDNDVEVNLPAGLVFASPNPDYDYQYMMLLQDYTFTAAPGDQAEILPTYCCNEDFDEPDDESNYSESDREWDRETQELLDLVADKALSNEDAVYLAQEALFEITDGDSGLTNSTRTKLSNLP